VGSKRTVLLVEDDPDVRDALSDFLSHAGLEVRTADHGWDALRKLSRDGPPSVMVVDLMMPVMDGWDFLLKCPEGVPIVVLSGVADIDRTRAHPDVAVVLQKPVTLEVLLNAVKPLAERSSG
jgi:DNA-binding response OmpR family regulator